MPGDDAPAGISGSLRSWGARLLLANQREVMMTEFGTEPTFRAYLQILRHRKGWVGSLTVLGLAASLAFSLTTHKQYSATAQLLVQPSLGASGLGAAQQTVTQTE